MLVETDSESVLDGGSTPLRSTNFHTITMNPHHREYQHALAEEHQRLCEERKALMKQVTDLDEQIHLICDRRAFAEHKVKPGSVVNDPFWGDNLVVKEIAFYNNGGKPFLSLLTNDGSHTSTLDWQLVKS